GYLDCGMGGIRDPRLVQNIADATFVAKKPSCKVLRAAAGLVHDIGLKGFHIKAVPVEQRWVEAS
ncbi:MAG: hypothetical protein KKB70_01780, partial [Proteobacteria bacterium]|nr:hypothetical protein [Pseudomonadota bacterium]